MFSFDKSTLGLTEDEIKQAESGSTSSGKYMTPGVHAVKIINAEHYSGKKGTIYSESDPTWVKLQVTYENPSGATKQSIIMFPTSKLTYTTAAGKETPFLFVKFKQFCASLGITVSADAAVLSKAMKTYFANPKKLIGMTSEIKIAYQNSYLNYNGKDNYDVRDVKGNILIAGPLTKDEADLAAGRQGITLQKFPDITDFIPKGAPAPEVKKPVEAKIEEDSW
jgi:hypothetical protein